VRARRSPQLDRRVVVPLPADAVSALAAAMSARYEAAVWLAAGAGLREGEALGLTVPRVEFLARRLVVVEQMQNRSLSPLWTKASTRVVPVDSVVLNAIAEHMRRSPPGPGGLLITNRLGRPVQRNSFGQWWRAAFEVAGLHSKAIQAGSATRRSRRRWTPTGTCSPTPTT
jgi:integrase